MGTEKGHPRLLECAELNSVACLLDVLGPDCLNDPDSCPHFIQSGTTAYPAHGRKGAMGKGKYPVRPCNLSIEDRRKKLVELKGKINCKGCGRKGHRKGDKECTMNQQKTAHLSVRARRSTIFDLDDDVGESDEPVAYMAVRSSSVKLYLKPMPVTHLAAGEPVVWTS